MKKLALLSGCLLLLACSDGGSGNSGQAGQGGGASGSGGTTGVGGTTGAAGTTGAGGSGGGGNSGSGGNNGSGGQTGGGGATGSGGSGGGNAGRGGTGGTGQTCVQIALAYATAMDQARMCRPDPAAPCPYLVASALSCGCQAWVGDRTELDRIKAEWDAAGCRPADLCPAITCPNPGTKATCLPNDSGNWCIGSSPTPAP